MKNVRVFDNGGISFDRYTVLIDGDAFGMSHNPNSPQGFNQYIGCAEEICIEALGSDITDRYLSLQHELFVAIHRRVNP